MKDNDIWKTTNKHKKHLSIFKALFSYLVSDMILKRGFIVFTQY